MRKTKNFNIQVPELGDVPDITQVSDAIQDLEDALAGTLEIMDASIQGSGLTLRSAARQTKRTKYYDGMSVRFLCPQTITANTLKTVVVDDLPQQVITVPFDIISGEYVDITYRGTSFTAHPVMIQKSESIDSNSNETVATSRAVKKVNDRVSNEVSELDKNKVSKSGDTMTGDLNIQRANIRVIHENGSYASIVKHEDGLMLWNAQSNRTVKLLDSGDVEIPADNLKTNYREVILAINELHDGKENAFEKKSGFNLDKTDSYTESNNNKVFTQKGANDLYKEVQDDMRNIDLSGKTDKGGYDGSAKDLKDEIDKKQNQIDNSLESDNKTVVGAINESLYRIYPKEIGSTTIQDDLNYYIAPGFYSSTKYKHLFLNTPEDIGDYKAFHLRVFSFSNRASYAEQILYSPSTKKSYRRFRHDQDQWSPWHELIDERSGQITGILGANYKKFPLFTAEVNDICYYAGTGKYFVCTTRYSGGILSMPNNNFEEMSVFINRDKLNSLYKTPKVITGTATRGNTKIPFDSEYTKATIYVGAGDTDWVDSDVHSVTVVKGVDDSSMRNVVLSGRFKYGYSEIQYDGNYINIYNRDNSLMYQIVFYN